MTESGSVAEVLATMKEQVLATDPLASPSATQRWLAVRLSQLIRARDEELETFLARQLQDDKVSVDDLRELRALLLTIGEVLNREREGRQAWKALSTAAEQLREAVAEDQRSQRAAQETPRDNESQPDGSPGTAANASTTTAQPTAMPSLAGPAPTKPWREASAPPRLSTPESSRLLPLPAPPAFVPPLPTAASAVASPSADAAPRSYSQSSLSQTMAEPDPKELDARAEEALPFKTGSTARVGGPSSAGEVLSQELRSQRPRSEPPRDSTRAEDPSGRPLSTTMPGLDESDSHGAGAKEALPFKTDQRGNVTARHDSVTAANPQLDVVETETRPSLEPKQRKDLPKPVAPNPLTTELADDEEADHDGSTQRLLAKNRLPNGKPLPFPEPISERPPEKPKLDPLVMPFRRRSNGHDSDDEATVVKESPLERLAEEPLDSLPEALSWFTMEHHAALFAACRLYPEHLDAVYRQFGVRDHAERQLLDRYWLGQLQHDAALYVRWSKLRQDAVAHYEPPDD